MSKAEQRWAFFVDESGRFEDPSDPVAVAGLLVAHSEPVYRPSDIRKALEASVPGFPWPLHASFLNQPAYVAVAAYQVEPSVLDTRRPGFGTVVRNAISICEAGGASDLNAIVGAIKSGRKLPYDALTRLGDLMRRRTPQVAQQLVDISREAWRAVDLVAQRLLAARDHLGRPIAYFVAASETVCGDAGQSDADRYFSVLRASIDRAASLVARRDGKQRLELYVQRRDVHDARFGRSVPLTPQHVGLVARGIADRHPQVQLVPAETPNYGSDVSVEYVLADFLANRSRRDLDDVQSHLPIVETRLGEYFGGPLRSGLPERSHLSASGDAWKIAVQGESIEWQPPRRRWACEQAMQWNAAQS